MSKLKPLGERTRVEHEAYMKRNHITGLAAAASLGQWRRAQKRKPVFVVVDDDREALDTLISLLKNAFPACVFRAYESLADADGCGQIDVLLTDTSAICEGSWTFVPSALAKFKQNHDSADIFIMSAMSRNSVTDFITDMRENYGVDTSRIWACGFQWDHTIRDCIKDRCTTLTGPQLSGLIE